MSKKNYTHIIFVLDRSGSMQSIRENIITGFNEFLNGQQIAEGDATATLIQFDNFYEEHFSFRPIREVQPLNKESFVPRGMTALHGAISKAMHDEGVKLANMPDSRRPDKVVMVILTDGGENDSHHNDWSKQYNAAKVASNTKHQQERYGWQFIYLGANQDAVREAATIGINALTAVDYDATQSGVHTAFKMSSDKLRSYRGSNNAADLCYSAAEKASHKQ